MPILLHRHPEDPACDMWMWSVLDTEGIEAIRTSHQLGRLACDKPMPRATLREVHRQSRGQG